MAALFRALASVAVLILMSTSASHAEDQEIAVYRGTPFPLLLERPFKTFLVGHPNIIDVHARGDRSVIVEGLAPGNSNIVFIDESDIAIANIRILVCDGSTAESDRDHEAACKQVRL